MNKYKFKLLTSTELGHEYFYCYGDEHFEQWLKRRNIKYEIDKKSINRFNKQKEVLDKIKEYCKNKIEEQKNMTDFSKYYLENYDKAINTQHLSHSGVMLETIKSTTIKRYEDILELLEEIE